MNSLVRVTVGAVVALSVVVAVLASLVISDTVQLDSLQQQTVSCHDMQTLLIGSPLRLPAHCVR